MFGDAAVPKTFKDDLLKINVNGKTVEINLSNFEVLCADDEILRDTVFTAVNKLNQVLVQPKTDSKHL